jgi:hypothetical protein
VSSLAQMIQALEVELHHPGVRCSRARLEQLLHPQFHEVGRSGRTYSRETVIEFLLSQGSPPTVRSEHFVCAELAPGVELLTYRSAHLQADGQLVNHTLRSSVWIASRQEAWQLRYHQGTPAAQAW